MTNDYKQGIFLCIKDVSSNKIRYVTEDKECEKFIIDFMPDKSEFEGTEKDLRTKLSIIVDANEPVEIRRLEIENNSNTEKILEVTGYFEPVLSKKEQDYSHQAFNNLFLTYEYDESEDEIITKRKKRDENQNELYLISKK